MSEPIRGYGKSRALRHLIDDALANGDRLIVADPTKDQGLADLLAFSGVIRQEEFAAEHRAALSRLFAADSAGGTVWTGSQTVVLPPYNNPDPQT